MRVVRNDDSTANFRHLLDRRRRRILVWLPESIKSASEQQALTKFDVGEQPSIVWSLVKRGS